VVIVDNASDPPVSHDEWPANVSVVHDPLQPPNLAYLSGFLAWVIWLFIHISFLTGFRNRLGALVSWWPAFVRDVRRERTYTTEQVGLVHSAYDVLHPSTAGGALPGSTTGAELPDAGAKPSAAGTAPSATGTEPSSRAG